MIYTSYYANLRNLPKDILPISIAGKCPNWYNGIEYKKVAPKIGFFMEWKQNHDNDFYIEHFNKEVLDTLDPKMVLNDLLEILENHKSQNVQHIALLCYEKPLDFCHRHLVADWLNKNIENMTPIKEWTKI